MATLPELENALRKADAAGNVDDARALANAIRQMRAGRPDFGNVQGGSDTMQGQQGQVTGFDNLKRQAGLGTRSMIQGVGGLVDIVASPFIAGINKLGEREQTTADLVRGETGRRFPRQLTVREGAGVIADNLGLPLPANPSERVSGNVTEALTGGGGFMGLGRQLATRLPGVVQRVGESMISMPRTQLASMVGGSGASGITRENGGGTGAQVAAGLIGGLAPAATTTSSSMGLRGLIRGGEGSVDPSTGQAISGRQLFEKNVSNFRSVGAQPSVGQAAANSRTRGLESLLSGGPTSTGVMSRFADQQADDIGSGLQRLGTDLSRKAGSEQAGRAIEKGSQTFSSNTKAMRQALYWQADQYIPQSTSLPLSRTQMTLAELTTPNQSAMATTGGLINPKIAQLAQNVSDDLAANSGAMPYSAVRELRSRIGEELADFSLSTDRPTAQYKRLYAALSQDLEEAARAQGPQAEQAYKRANSYMRASADRIEQLDRVVGKAGGPEAVYNAALSGTKDGATTLRAVMQSLPEDGQRALTGAVVKRMGLATPGHQDASGEVFSAQTFLTKWNALSPEAKRALFHRHGPKFAADMDKVAGVASNLRDGSKVFANPSGTANRAAAYSYGIGTATSVLASPVIGPLPALAAISSGVAANALARAMTNPKFVSWLARSTELPVSSLPQQIIVLNQMAKSDPDLAEVAEAISSGQQPPQQGADAR